jgi:hypothetical protein
MIYDFNIKTAGYDLPAFIKNPDNVCADNTGASNTGSESNNILELLKLTNTKWLQCEQEYNILKYVKSKVTPDLVRTSGLFRSVVHSNGNILAFSPPKSINEGQFMSQYPPSECYAEEIIDGTMINLFYDKLTKSWEISSKSKFGAKCIFFNTGSLKEEETFRYMFFEVCKEIDFDYTSLPKENCYSFVFQHPRNRIVVPINEMKLYLIASYQINNENYTIRKLENEEMTTFMKGTYIRRPKTYNFTTYDDLETLIAVMNEDYKEAGIMIYHTVSCERTKIRNPNYEFVRCLRGNQPKLQYRYLEMRQNGQVAAYLRYYPEAQADFNKFKKQIHDFTEKLHTHYISCYIKKSKPLLEYEEKFRTHMFNIHQIYKKKPEGQGKIITKTDVITYVNTLPEPLLMSSLNSALRVEE